MQYLNSTVAVKFYDLKQHRKRKIKLFYNEILIYS